MKEIILYNQEQNEIFRADLIDEEMKKLKRNISQHPNGFIVLPYGKSGETMFNLNLISNIVINEMPNRN